MPDLISIVPSMGWIRDNCQNTNASGRFPKCGHSPPSATWSNWFTRLRLDTNDTRSPPGVVINALFGGAKRNSAVADRAKNFDGTPRVHPAAAQALIEGPRNRWASSNALSNAACVSPSTNVKPAYGRLYGAPEASLPGRYVRLSTHQGHGALMDKTGPARNDRPAPLSDPWCCIAWIRAFLKQLRRHKNKPQIGSGHTITTGPTWPSVGLHLP